jgi:hypothetical protein
MQSIQVSVIFTVLVRRVPAAAKVPQLLLTSLQAGVTKVLSVPRNLSARFIPAPVADPLGSEQSKVLLTRWQQVKQQALGE